ncbi:unnamed protein product [Parnassius apollo]|uniref:(apollo) hypothetical protein n=1 Tax=Parnassius apollo TaxID=110799 RepID=A0A8S3WP09_PARAO|nr:unnamed protein product [Parnassius apollo]
MPTDSSDNLVEFMECLSQMAVIINKHLLTNMDSITARTLRKRSFEVLNGYRGLEEAIESILNEKDDPNVSYDIVATPPDPNILTNKEEGYEGEVRASDIVRENRTKLPTIICQGHEKEKSSRI